MRKNEFLPPAGTNIEKIGYPLLALSLFLALWQGVAAAGIYTEFQLPPPLSVFHGIVELWRTGSLWSHLGVSLYRFGAAYLLAVVTALPLGLLFGWYTRLYYAFDPFVQLLRPISPIAWFPLAVLWFKVGDPPAIFIIFLSAFFPILLSAVAAVRSVDPSYLKVAVNFGTRKGELLWKIVLPAAFPQVMFGLHLALGSAWVYLVAGEMLGAQSGLGFLIVDARNFLRTDLVISGMVLIGLLGLILDKAIGYIELSIRKKWGGSVRN